MKIEEVHANIVLDSRGEETIAIDVNHCRTIAPSGKSKGRYEAPAYKKNPMEDSEFINKIALKSFPEIDSFEDLEKIEKKFKKNIGANTLFALEASILKALAKSKRLELWQLLNVAARVFPRIISNTIGGGAHSSITKIKPDFQEFLVTCNKNPALASVVNRKAHENAEAILKNLSSNSPKKNDENAWTTDEDNESVLEIMKNIQENVFDETGTSIAVGLDCAASQFYKNGSYNYLNRKATRGKKEQIEYISMLAKKYDLFYIEDPLDEEDFEGFAELVKKCNCLIVGDDLTVTNFKRTEKAIKMEAITGIIIKPNQTGSLLEVKKIIDLCQKFGIKTIMSHRSGESVDDTIADLAFAWQCDFIKVPVVGRERFAKVDRLMRIEQGMK
ncbi:MAG: enolase C-terminal domain-like protein [Nanoarchaeota archaeon]